MVSIKKDHEWYMRQALKQAEKAFAANEVPIGAVVVDEQGSIIARGYNQMEKRFTQAAHAEIIALTKASRKRKNWRLNGCWLYVTLEPCIMCMGFMLLSRLEGVAFGASSPLFGYQLDKYHAFSVYQSEQFDLQVVKGIGAPESAEILKRFFRSKRKSARG